MAIKLSKMQAQAIISKLGREVNNLRDKLIEDEKRNYTPSSNYTKFAELLEKRDKFKVLSEAAMNEAMKFACAIGVSGYYTFTEADEALKKLRNREIEVRHPKVDTDAALDDLIIESVEDDFSVDSFIEHYLKQVRNE